MSNLIYYIEHFSTENFSQSLSIGKEYNGGIRPSLSTSEEKDDKDVSLSLSISKEENNEDVDQSLPDRNVGQSLTMSQRGNDEDDVVEVMAIEDAVTPEGKNWLGHRELFFHKVEKN